MIHLIRHVSTLRGLKLHNNTAITNNLSRLFCNRPPQTGLSARTHSLEKYTVKTVAKQAMDGIPATYERIYNSYESHVLVYSTSVVFVVAAMMLICGHIMMQTIEFFPDYATTFRNAFLASLFFGANFTVVYFGRKFPVRIYYNKDTKQYKAIFTTNSIFKTRIVDYTRENVKQIPPSEKFPWKFSPLRYSKFSIKGENVYLHEEYFRYPGDFVNMLSSETYWRDLD